MGVAGMVFGVVKSWGWSPHEWNNCPCKKRLASVFSLLCTLWGQLEKMVVCKPGFGSSPDIRSWSASTLILKFVVSRTASNKGLLFKATQCKVTCYTSVNWKKEKVHTQCETCKLSIWGNVRIPAQKTAPQIARRNCFKVVWGGGGCGGRSGVG